MHSRPARLVQILRWTSGFPAVAQPSSIANPSERKEFSPVTSIDDSIAVDPIKYVGIPLSLNDFEPDRDVINDDGMPGKPFSPFGPVLGFDFHFIHPSFWSANGAAKRPVHGTVETRHSAGFSVVLGS
jgi:hypothetical protein